MKYVHTNIVAQDWRKLSEVIRHRIPWVGPITFVYATDPEGNFIELQKRG